MHRALILAFAVTTSAALAQDLDAAALKATAEATSDQVAVSTENIRKLRKERPKLRGWDLGLKLGASGAFLQNSNFVGQTEGITLQFGGVLSGNADYVTGDHEWRNSLIVEHAQLKTPAIQKFVKNIDGLEARSLYLYRVPAVDWLGPFARVRLFTQLFPGELVRAENRTVLEKRRDGGVTVRQVPAQTPIDLTAAFEPLVLEQSGGLFLEPLRSPSLTVDARVGLGAREVFAQDGKAVADDPATPELELTQLATVISAGVELEGAAQGIIVEELLSWNASAGSYYPLLVNNDRDLKGLGLLHLFLGAGVSLKLSKWLSLDYGIKVLRQPFVLDELQIQNTVLLSTGFDILRTTVKEKPPKPAPEPPPAADPPPAAEDA